MPDPRNIIDPYKYWTNEAIVADLDTKRHNFGVLCVNIQGDFNVGSVVRNANAFLAQEVILYGRKRFDRRGSVGTYNYTHFRHVREVDSLDIVLNDYELVVGVDNVEEAAPLEIFEWPTNKKVLMCFGEENSGLIPEIVTRCDSVVFIRQYGSVRSLNVGCASGIAMYDYCRKINAEICSPLGRA